MRLPLVALVALLAAPSALGQFGLVPSSLGVSASDPGGGGLMPGAITQVGVAVNYDVPRQGRPAPAPTFERPEGTAPTRITLAANAVPSWVTNVTFDPPEFYVYVDVGNATTTSYRRTSIAHLNLSPDAPAQQREPFIVTATAEPNGNIAGATADSPELRLYARVVGVANVSGPERVVLPGGRWSSVEFNVRNDGNAPILMKINVTVRPENSQVEFEDTLQLDANASTMVPVRVRTPWNAAEFGTLELEATPIVDGEAATPSRATVDVLGESAVPGVPVWGLLALLALAGFQRQHRLQR